MARPQRLVAVFVAVPVLMAALTIAAASPAAAASVPGAPTSFTATFGHAGWAELNWNPPASDGGSPIVDYVVTSTPPTDCSVNGDFPATQCIVDYGVTYTFSVAAENDVGIGPPSNTSSGTPVPLITISDAGVVEGNAGPAAMNFTVSLDGGSAQPITVAYTTNGDTATAGVDFTAASGVLTFAPHTTTATVTVNVLGDTLHEANEKLHVRLSSPTNAVLRDRVGLGTITDDDAPPTLSISDATATEGSKLPANVAHFFVTLSTANGVKTTVHWATAPGTATVGLDYAGVSGVLTIPAGRTQAVINVRITPDTLHEPNETFTVTLSAPAGATIADGTGLGTILDDD